MISSNRKWMLCTKEEEEDKNFDGSFVRFASNETWDLLQNLPEINMILVPKCNEVSYDYL